MKQVAIKLNGKKIKCNEGASVLQVAIDHNIEIPHFCYHEDLPIDANCRVCLVEVDGKVMTSCTLKAQAGLAVKLNTPAVAKLRKENMELLLAGHTQRCPKCQKNYACQTREQMEKYGVTGKKYERPCLNLPIHKMGSAAEFDPEQCIGCNKCVEMCQKIGIGFLQLKGQAAKNSLAITDDKCVDCIYCGQCTVHCPVAAVREQNQIEQVKAALKDKSKIVIAQCAPSVRCSIGEEFGVKPGTNLMGEINTALRQLGFDRVFDVNMGADITTWVEAKELVERIKNGGPFPMFTSCCPGWVKMAEFYYPAMLEHLTTARSPQIHSGGAYKTWWAEEEGIDPHNIVVVSLMPCTSKKYEAQMDKFKVDGHRPVDYVLTTREFAVLLKDQNIDLPKLKKSTVDPYGTFSGAAAIYGASGGVMESALRTAYHFLTGKELKKVEFKQVRGMQGVKRATIAINGHKLKVAVVATAANVKLIMEEIKKDPNAYHYIEVMSCPGGCIGGGGQPIPSTERIIAQRIAGLYQIDDKMQVRCAHKNPIVRRYMEEYIPSLPEHKQRELLYTSYSKKKRFE
ncbi:[FeFe] hydrogenase, group A [Patescibacteria group bacterium]|nr:[FeFe] hydrogenase, group A [Patescibacteria group bacterium]MBU1705829.1 [FeFe] hydrogenase, group A [Patescibacteria group bacterium]